MKDTVYSECLCIPRIDGSIDESLKALASCFLNDERQCLCISSIVQSLMYFKFLIKM